MRSILTGVVFSLVTKTRSLLVSILRLRKKLPPIQSPILRSMAAINGRPLRVAVLRFDGLGDTALTLPLIESLQQSSDVYEVVTFLPEKISSALDGFYSGKVYSLRPFSIHYPRFKSIELSSVVTYSLFGGIASFMQGRFARKELGLFDLVVLPRWDHDLDLNTRFFARGLGGFVLGHNPRWIEHSTREVADISLLDIVCDSPDKSAHDFSHLEDLATCLGLKISKRQVGALRKRVDSDATVFVQLGAAAPKRIWDLDNWIQLLSLVVTNHPNWSFIINSSTKTDFEAITNSIPIEFKNAFSLLKTEQKGALKRAFQKTHLYLGSDTGPLHIAEFLNIPSVVISCHPQTGRPDHVNSPNRFGNTRGLGIWISPEFGLDDCVECCEKSISHCINQLDALKVSRALDDFVATKDL